MEVSASSEVIEWRNTHLELLPRTIRPFGVFRQTKDVPKRLDPHLDLTRVVENTAVSVHEILDDREVIICGRVAEDGVVPCLQVGVLLDKVGQSIPLVLRSDQARAIVTDSGNGGRSGSEGVCGPRCLVVRSAERGTVVQGGVRLAENA